MASLDQRIDKLLESIEDEFYNKRKRIISEFEKIERIKRVDYQEVRSKLSLLKTSEQKVESLRKGIEKKLRRLMSDIKVLKDKKLFLLQTPHFFINTTTVEKNIGSFSNAPGENDMFYHGIQLGLDMQ